MNKKEMKICLIILLIIIIVAVIIFLQKNEVNIQINIEGLAEEIAKSSAFEDQLEKVDSEMTMQDYNFSTDEVAQLVSYQGSGASSEEIVILQVKEKSNINSVKDKINTRLAERKEAFESYLPEEVGKIDNSILRVEGNYIILCVAKEANTVNNVINEYIK